MLMKNEKFYCKNCKRFFDETKSLEERHGLSSPPYEIIAICPFCSSDNFEGFDIKVEKGFITEKLLPAIMHLNKHLGAIKDVFGMNIENSDLEYGIEILIETIGEMFDFLDRGFQDDLFDMCTDYDVLP